MLGELPLTTVDPLTVLIVVRPIRNHICFWAILNGCVHSHAYKSPLPEEETRSDSSGVRARNPKIALPTEPHALHARSLKNQE